MTARYLNVRTENSFQPVDVVAKFLQLGESGPEPDGIRLNAVTSY